MSNLSDLIAQRAALDEKIKALTETQRAGAIEQVTAIMREHGLTPADLRVGARGDGKPKTPKTGESKKVAVKYHDKAGNTWSGRGLKPKWLQAAIASGKKIEEFAV